MACRIRGIVVMLFLSAFALHAAENYTTWTYHQTLMLNTGTYNGTYGANVTGTVTNFPVLVRLTAANAAVFTYAAAGGADLRFSKSNYADTLSYQIQRWDATNQLAEIWVLVDTVYGSNTTQSIVMHYGNGAAPSHSSGPAVFNAVSGYAAVWHLQDTTDACGKLPLTGATKPTIQYGGVIGSAYHFDGASLFFKTADSTSAHVDSLNFAYTTPFTLSGWEYDNIATAGNRKIVSKSGSTWNMGERNPTGEATYDLEMVVTGGPTGDVGYLWDTTSIAPVIPPATQWHHIVGVRSPTQGTSPTYVESLYVDGVLSDNPVPHQTPGATAATNRAIDIGYEPDANTQTNPNTYYWNGGLDEVEISTAARSSAWVKLSYQNQQATQTLVQFAGLTVSSPTLTSPANGGINQPIAPTLTWTGVNGVQSYSVQVATNSGFTNTVFSKSGIATTSQAITPDLANGTTYYWQANALAANGTTSPWSGVWSFTTIGPVTLLSPANGATGQSTSPTLTWGSVTGATSYSLQVSTSTAFTNFAYSTFNITGTSQEVPAGDLTSLVSYYWRADAYNGATSITNWSGAWSFTTGPITLASPTNGAIDQLFVPTLTWNGVAGATSYSVQVSTSPAFATMAFSGSNITGTWQAATGLAAGTTYYWQANALTDGTTSPWSSVWSFTTIGLVTPLSPANGATGQSVTPALTWNGVAGATSYSVQVSTSPAFSSVAFTQSGINGTSQVTTSLTPGATYYWQVNVLANGTTSPWSSAWNFETMTSTPSNVPILVSPSNGAVNVPINTTLAWNAVSGATSYRVQFSNSTSFLLVSDTTVDTTLRAISSLTNNAVYYWRVNATNSSGVSSWSTIDSFTTVPLVPVTPALISPANGTVNAPLNTILAWNPSSGATSYRVQLSNTTSFALVNDTTLDTTSRVVSLLSTSTTYYWRVYAINVSGVSAWSSVWSFSTITTSVLSQKTAAYSKGISFSNSAITYDLPAVSSVSIALYDMQGRKVRQFVNAMQNAGLYSIDFKHAKVTAGYYIVEFKAGSFIVQKKMALID